MFEHPINELDVTKYSGISLSMARSWEDRMLDPVIASGAQAFDHHSNAVHPIAIVTTNQSPDRKVYEGFYLLRLYFIAEAAGGSGGESISGPGYPG